MHADVHLGQLKSTFCAVDHLFRGSLEFVRLPVNGLNLLRALPLCNRESMKFSARIDKFSLLRVNSLGLFKAIPSEPLVRASCRVNKV